jgi:hypothetical protein
MSVRAENALFDAVLVPSVAIIQLIELVAAYVVKTMYQPVKDGLDRCVANV